MTIGKDGTYYCDNKLTDQCSIPHQTIKPKEKNYAYQEKQEPNDKYNYALPGASKLWNFFF